MVGAPCETDRRCGGGATSCPCETEVPGQDGPHVGTCGSHVGTWQRGSMWRLLSQTDDGDAGDDRVAFALAPTLPHTHGPHPLDLPRLAGSFRLAASSSTLAVVASNCWALWAPVQIRARLRQDKTLQARHACEYHHRHVRPQPWLGPEVLLVASQATSH